MPKLVWDAQDSRLYETGTSMGVLYTRQKGNKWTGEAWNGLAAVKHSPDGGEETSVYANNQKYLGLMSRENFKGSIEAYTYPEGFDACQGLREVVAGFHAGQQTRTPFGLTYRTIIGNDSKYDEYGYKQHIIYNAKVSPTSKDYETVNDTPNALLFTWEFSTTPPEVTSALIKPTAYFVADSTKLAPAKLTLLETKLYGGTEVGAVAELPTVAELLTLLAN